MLKGLRIPGQGNSYLIQAENPEVWLPPDISDVEIEVFKIEDDDFFKPIGGLQIPYTDTWQQADMRQFISSEDSYSVRVTYVDGHSGKTRNWTKTISVFGDINAGHINNVLPQVNILTNMYFK